MSENAVSSEGSMPPSPELTLRQRVRRLLPLFAVGATLILALWLVFDKSSPVYALITPPFTPDFSATGQFPFQQFGFAVEAAGDVNDDGFGDVVVGSDLSNTVYIFAGSSTGLTTTAFYSDSGTPGENLGYSVSGGDDVNGDDVDDFVVGAYISGSGSAYVYFGASIGLPTRGATLTGELSGDQFGWSVAAVGDVNGDTIGDVAVGAPSYGLSDTGRVYIYYGPVAGTVVTAGVILSGENPLDTFGFSVSGAGDVNGDGIDDLIVGAQNNEDGGSAAGKAYVFYGSNTGISQSNSNAVTGSPNDKLGTFVHSAGDVNGDGFGDVIVGADTFNFVSPSVGRAELYPGGPSGLISTTLYTALGESDNDHFGFAVAGNGDLDGDGFSDFAVGAHEFDISPVVSTTNEGKAYGYVACTNGAISPSLIFSDTGGAPLDYYGRSLAIVGDVNGDNLDDLVVGAYSAKTALLLPVGKVFAYYGVAGGCRPALELTKTVGLFNFPALFTNTTEITVPTDAIVRYNYVVTNTGNVTLTRHVVVDDKLPSTIDTFYTLTPGINVSVIMTGIPGASAAPGVSVTNIATWTGSISITSPSGVTTPTNRTLFTQANATARVNISGPALDQDGDTIPDNVEGSGNPDSDNLPSYLDLDSDGDGFSDQDEVGPDPNNPIDRDLDQIPGYLDDDEDPTTVPPVGTPIAGLSVTGPSTAYPGDSVQFTAVITAGSTPITYTWDFGDSQTGSSQTNVISHTYTSLGFYVVEVTATNAVNEKTANKSIFIKFPMRLPRVQKGIGTD